MEDVQVIIGNKDETINHIPAWSCCTTYTEPTEVLFDGEMCIVWGTNEIPIPAPKRELLNG